jgi:hypothetical protein
MDVPSSAEEQWGYATLANTYRPLATRTNNGDEPAEWEASTQLTEFAETDSPSDASTAA